MRLRHLAGVMLAVALVLGINGLASADLTTDLVAYYPFDGNANDYSGKGNNPTTNTATLTADRFGQAEHAYLFNGSNSYIQYPHQSWLNIDINKGFTVATWFKIVGLGSDYFDIIDKSHGVVDSTGWVIQGNSSSQSPRNMGFGVRYGGGGDPDTFYAAGGAVPPAGEWHHLAGTFENNTLSYYLDGILVDTHTGKVANNTRDLFIGKHYSLGRYFDGAIDDIRIYERALSGEEIAQLAGVPLPGAAWLLGSGLAGLLAYGRRRRS